MSEIIFFEPKGPLFLKDLFEDISKDNYKTKIFDIKTLENASSKDLTFYKEVLFFNLIDLILLSFSLNRLSI